MKISIINFDEIKYSSSIPLTVLSYFLTDDVGARNVQSLISWLKNDQYESAVLNYSYIKKDENKVELYCFYDGYEREEHKDREKFEVEMPELIRIVMQWRDLYAQKHFPVKISEEEDGVFLTGRLKR